MPSFILINIRFVSGPRRCSVDSDYPLTLYIRNVTDAEDRCGVLGSNQGLALELRKRGALNNANSKRSIADCTAASMHTCDQRILMRREGRAFQSINIRTSNGNRS